MYIICIRVLTNKENLFRALEKQRDTEWWWGTSRRPSRRFSFCGQIRWNVAAMCRSLVAVMCRSGGGRPVRDRTTPQPSFTVQMLGKGKTHHEVKEEV